MSEEEFAMKYAAERRMRIGLERRLHALVYNTVPFLNVTSELCADLVEMNHQKIAVGISKLTDWRSDMEINVLINMFRPTGTLDIFNDNDAITNGCMADLPEAKLEAMQRLTKIASDEVTKEWDRFADGTNIAKSDQYREENRNMMQELVMEQKVKRQKEPESRRSDAQLRLVPKPTS